MTLKLQITHGMFLALVVSIIYPKAVGVTQGILARQIGGDMWIATIFATIFAAIFMMLMVVMIKRLPEKSLLEQSEVLFGKWLSKVISLAFFVFFLGAYGQMMITFVYHLRDYFLPDAPILLFIIVPMVAGYIAVYHGLEVIARLALIGLLAIVIFNFILIIGSLEDFDVYGILPVLRNGFLENVMASRHHLVDWAMVTMMAAIILPMVKDKQKWGKVGQSSVFYAGVFVIVWPILQIGVLTPQLTGQFTVSCMLLARSAQIGLFIHRYEMIMVIFYSFPLLISIMMITMCASSCLAHTVGKKDTRSVLLVVTVILGGFSYWVVFDHVRAMDLLTYYWPPIALPIAFGIPIIIWIAGFLLKKKLENEKNSSSIGQ